MIRILLSLVTGMVLCIGSGMAADKPVKGTITKVEKEGSNIVVVVSVTAKKKDTAAGNVEKQKKKFIVRSETKVEKVTGKKDNQKHTAAKAEDLKEGMTVAITTSGDKVEKVEINGGKKVK